MKTLILLRHAKAEEKSGGMADVERALTEAGTAAARAAGTELAARGIVPDLIVCSQAVRARRTAELAAQTAGYRGAVVAEATLYSAGAGDYRELLAATDSSVSTLMIIGHNPAIERFAAQAAGAELSMSPGDLLLCSLDLASWGDALRNPRLSISATIKA